MLTLFFKFLLEHNLKDPVNINEIANNLFSHFFLEEKNNKISNNAANISINAIDEKKSYKKQIKTNHYKETKNALNIEANCDVFENILSKLKIIKSDIDLSLICDEILHIKSISCKDINLLEDVHNNLKKSKKHIKNFNSNKNLKIKMTKSLKKITNRIGNLNRNKK